MVASAAEGPARRPRVPAGLGGHPRRRGPDHEAAVDQTPHDHADRALVGVSAVRKVVHRFGCPLPKLLQDEQLSSTQTELLLGLAGRYAEGANNAPQAIEYLSDRAIRGGSIWQSVEPRIRWRSASQRHEASDRLMHTL